MTRKAQQNKGNLIVTLSSKSSSKAKQLRDEMRKQLRDEMRVLNCFCLRSLPIFTTDIRYFITGYVTIDDVAKTVDVTRTSGGDRGYPFLLSVDFNSSKTTGRYEIMTNKMSVSWSYSCMDAGEPISMTSSLVSNTYGQI